MPFPIQVKAVQDAIALTTAARTFDPPKHKDDEDCDIALLTLLEGRTANSMMRAMLVMAYLLSERITEDQMKVMAAEYMVMDRKAVVVL